MSNDAKPHDPTDRPGRGSLSGALPMLLLLLLFVLAVVGILTVLRGPLPPLPPLPLPLPSPAWLLLLIAVPLLLLLLFCCCCKQKGPDLVALMQVMLEPFFAALKIIGSSLALIAEAIVALTKTLAGVIAMLDTIAELVRNLPVAQPPPGAPDPKDGITTLIDAAKTGVNDGVAGLQSLGQRVGDAADNIASLPGRHPKI